MAPRTGGAKPTQSPLNHPSKSGDASSCARAPSRATFSRAQRVRRRAEFLKIQGVGRRVSTRSFHLLVSSVASPRPAGGNLPPARLGVVVTRKIGNAVVRNRIKRLCREVFRGDPTWLPPGVDLVVIARRGPASLSLAGVLAEWQGVRALLAERGREALAQPTERAHVPGSRTGTRAGARDSSSGATSDPNLSRTRASAPPRGQGPKKTPSP